MNYKFHNKTNVSLNSLCIGSEVNYKFINKGEGGLNVKNALACNRWGAYFLSRGFSITGGYN